MAKNLCFNFSSAWQGYLSSMNRFTEQTSFLSVQFDGSVRNRLDVSIMFHKNGSVVKWLKFNGRFSGFCIGSVLRMKSLTPFCASQKAHHVTARAVVLRVGRGGLRGGIAGNRLALSGWPTNSFAMVRRLFVSWRLRAAAFSPWLAVSRNAMDRNLSCGTGYCSIPP